jgi:hypothetical protein
MRFRKNGLGTGGTRLETELVVVQRAVVRGDEEIAGRRRQISLLCAQGLDASEARAVLRSCKDRQRERLAERAKLMAASARQRSTKM